MRVISLSLLVLSAIQDAPEVNGFVPSISSPLTRHRGGGLSDDGSSSYATSISATSSTSSDSEDDDVIDVDVEPVEVDVVTSKFADVAANTAKPMSNFGMDEETKSQQSKSLFLSAALWGSLALDTVLNKKKRLIIFPGLASVWEGGEAVGAAAATATGALSLSNGPNLAASGMVASGFLLSSGLAALISDDLKKDSDNANEGMRKKLSLLLFIFGVTNLCGNLNPPSASYFGMGGFIINVHNSLISLNGWLKEESSSKSNTDDDPTMGDFFKTFRSVFTPITKPVNASMGALTTMTSSLMRVCGIIAIMRGVSIVSTHLLPHYMACFAAKSLSVAPLAQLQMMGLQWAALSRAILAGGACLILKGEVDNGLMKRRMGKILALVLSACAIVAGVPSLMSGSPVDFSAGLKLVSFALITGVSSVVS